MKHCVVIGGGLAGLSAGVLLSKKGFNVNLLEAAPKLGGRATSFRDTTFDENLDNGQHILMGCYRETLAFMREIGAESNLIFQPHLSVNFRLPGGSAAPLDAVHSFYPLNLLTSIMKYSALGFKEKIAVIQFIGQLPFQTTGKLEQMSAEQWLRKAGQNINVQKAIWDFLCIGALNASPRNASAGMFAKILREIFLKDNDASTIILPKHDLLTTFVEPAKTYIESRGGALRTGARVEKINLDNNRAHGVTLSTGEQIQAETIISTVPPFALQKILPEELRGRADLAYEYSAILTFHLLMDGEYLEKPFYGLIDSPLHWVFNHGRRLTTVISGANDLIEEDTRELFVLIAGELHKYFGIEQKHITAYRAVKEKRATFLPTAQLLTKRKSHGINAKGLFIAGDWTDTGLPATIESAIMSGRIAALQAEKMLAKSL